MCIHQEDASDLKDRIPRELALVLNDNQKAEQLLAGPFDIDDFVRQFDYRLKRKQGSSQIGGKGKQKAKG
jgi:hypothetical protein